MQVARTLRLVGNSGIGKSTVAAASIERAHDAGWLAVLETAHRVQARLPFALARRIGAGILAALGERSELFAAGLPSDFTTERDGAKNEEALYRLIEAVLLDFPLLVAVDDMQWCDPESLSLLLRLLERFADQRFALLSIERLDEPGWEGLTHSDASFVLDALVENDARALARSLLPDASDEAIARIAEISAGRAIDIVAIAESLAQGGDDIAAVAAGLRAVVARDLAVMTPERREFLQMLALMEEPISLALLQHLWSEEHFLPLLQTSTGRYLTSAPTGIAFRHAALAQAIRETIAIDVPYRRRIIAAISKLPAPTSSDLEQIIAQARACGDSNIELTYLKQLAHLASEKNELPLLARALERTITLMPFTGIESLAQYTQLTMIYNGLSCEHDAIRVSEAGLAEANAAGVRSGLGGLVAPLLFAAWHSGDRKRFDSIMERYSSTLETDSDSFHLAYVRLSVAVLEFDQEKYHYENQAIRLPKSPNPIDITRLAIMRALMGARNGKDEEYEHHILQARSISENLPKPLRYMIDAIDRVRTVHKFGPSHQWQVAQGALRRQSGDGFAAARALQALSIGAIDDVFEIVSEELVTMPFGFEARTLLGIAGGAAAIASTPLPTALYEAAKRESALFLRQHRDVLRLPLAAATAVIEAERNRAFANALFDRVFEIATTVAMPPQIYFLPVTMAKAAHALNHSLALSQIAAGVIKVDKQRWSRAQAGVAALCALKWGGGHSPTVEREDLRVQFDYLNAPYFMSLLYQKANTANPAAGNNPSFSRREQEVISLVAEGLTNRLIAEQLVLSERTIEGHLANIFGKLGVSSRSQVATWFIRQAIPYASTQ